MAAAKKTPDALDTTVASGDAVIPAAGGDAGTAPAAGPPALVGLVDPEPVGTPDEPPTPTPLADGHPDRRVRVTQSAPSFEAGGGHYTLRAGDIMVVGEAVASELIAQRMAEEY